MIGIIVLKEQNPKITKHSFSDLKVGDGIESIRGDGVRIKVEHNFYLHFQQEGNVISNEEFYWPQREFEGTIKKFKLTAEEV